MSEGSGTVDSCRLMLVRDRPYQSFTMVRPITTRSSICQNDFPVERIKGQPHMPSSMTLLLNTNADALEKICHDRRMTSEMERDLKKVCRKLRRVASNLEKSDTSARRRSKKNYEKEEYSSDDD